jgi:RHH-type rel operon transcriptional repressor/antitoxin RelB
MLGVRLPEDLNRRLSNLALQTKRPKSFYVKEAIAEYLDEHESIYQAVVEYEKQKREGTLVTYTLEEVMQRNGISDEDLDNTDI